MNKMYKFWVKPIENCNTHSHTHTRTRVAAKKTVLNRCWYNPVNLLLYTP